MCSYIAVCRQMSTIKKRMFWVITRQSDSLHPRECSLSVGVTYPVKRNS